MPPSILIFGSYMKIFAITAAFPFNAKNPFKFCVNIVNFKRKANIYHMYVLNVPIVSRPISGEMR